MDRNESRTSLPERQSTLRDVVEDEKRLWLYCNHCHRSRYLETREWIERHNLSSELDTPLLLLARRVVCQRCNSRAVQIATEPYGNLAQRDERQALIATNYSGITCPICGTDAVACFVTRVPWIAGRPQFMPGTQFAECECLDCRNWWTQPREPTRPAGTSYHGLGLQPAKPPSSS
jgi:hypothetical protein